MTCLEYTGLDKLSTLHRSLINKMKVVDSEQRERAMTRFNKAYKMSADNYSYLCTSICSLDILNGSIAEIKILHDLDVDSIVPLSFGLYLLGFLNNTNIEIKTNSFTNMELIVKIYSSDENVTHGLQTFPLLSWRDESFCDDKNSRPRKKFIQ